MSPQLPLRLLILGDSITAGCDETGVTAENAYPRLVLQGLQDAGISVELTVSALHGAYTGYVLRRFERMVSRYSPDVVLILLGSNDAGPASDQPPVCPADFESHLRQLVERCAGMPALPVIASPMPRTDRVCDFPMEDYAHAAHRVAAECGVPLIDLHGVFSRTDRFAELIPDGQHPGPAGNRLMASVLVDGLASRLSALDRSTRQLY